MVIQFLEFTFQNGWHFFGVVILLGMLGFNLVALIVGSLGALRGSNVNIGGSDVKVKKKGEL